MQTEFVWVDSRWQEAHWLEVFRMRLCGWLPADLTINAISNGLFLDARSSGSFTVVLTEESHRLTDIGALVDGSSHNCVMLANVLITKGLKPNWLIPKKHIPVSYLIEHQVFPKRFRDGILKEISTLDQS